jgi:hypothetical protein
MPLPLLPSFFFRSAAVATPGCFADISIFRSLTSLYLEAGYIQSPTAKDYQTLLTPHAYTTQPMIPPTSPPAVSAKTSGLSFFFLSSPFDVQVISAWAPQHMIFCAIFFLFCFCVCYITHHGVLFFSVGGFVSF